MKTKTIVAGIVILAIAGFAVYKQNNKEITPMDSGTSAPHETTNPNAGGTNTTPDVSTGTTYTMAEVATHNNKSNCWTTINGGVYNVTSWITQHPGGQQAILGLCGIDGSSAFNAQHGGQARPESELASFKVGVLAK
jgi:cytochrome b involved in lipid metabolism